MAHHDTLGIVSPLVGTVTVTLGSLAMGDANGDLINSAFKQDDILSEIVAGTTGTPMAIRSTGSITSGGGLTVTLGSLFNSTVGVKDVATFEKDITAQSTITWNGVKISANLVSGTLADGKFAQFRKDVDSDMVYLDAVDAPSGGSSGGGSNVGSITINGMLTSRANVVPGDLHQTYSKRRFEIVKSRLFDIYNKIEYLPCDGREVSATIYPELDSWIEVTPNTDSIGSLTAIPFPTNSPGRRVCLTYVGDNVGYILTLEQTGTSGVGTVTPYLYKFNYSTNIVTLLLTLPTVASTQVDYFGSFHVCEVGHYFCFANTTLNKFFVHGIEDGVLWGEYIPSPALNTKSSAMVSAVNNEYGDKMLFCWTVNTLFYQCNINIDLNNKIISIVNVYEIDNFGTTYGQEAPLGVSQFFLKIYNIVFATLSYKSADNSTALGFDCEFGDKLFLNYLDAGSDTNTDFISIYPLLSRPVLEASVASVLYQSTSTYTYLSDQNLSSYDNYKIYTNPVDIFKSTISRFGWNNKKLFHIESDAPYRVAITFKEYPDWYFNITAGLNTLVAGYTPCEAMKAGSSAPIGNRGVLIGGYVANTTTAAPLFYVPFSVPTSYTLPRAVDSYIAMPYKQAVKNVATLSVNARAISDNGNLTPVEVTPYNTFFSLEYSGSGIFAAANEGYIYSGDALSTMSPAPGGSRTGLVTIFNAPGSHIYAVMYEGTTITIQMVGISTTQTVFQNAAWTSAPIDGSFGNYICLPGIEGNLSFASPTDYVFTNITVSKPIGRVAAIGDYTFGVSVDGTSVYRYYQKGTSPTEIYNNAGFGMTHIAANSTDVFVCGSTTMGSPLVLVIQNAITGATPTAIAYEAWGPTGQGGVNCIDCFGSNVVLSTYGDNSGGNSHLFYQSSDGLATAPKLVNIPNVTGNKQMELRMTSDYDFVTIDEASAGGTLYYYVSENNYNTAPRNWQVYFNYAEKEKSIVTALNSVGDLVYSTLGNPGVWEYKPNVLGSVYTFHQNQNFIKGNAPGKFFIASDNGVIGKSLDGGLTWEVVGSTGKTAMGGFCQLGDGTLIFGSSIGTGGSVLTSTDEGVTWVESYVTDDELHICILPYNAQVAIFATSDRYWLNNCKIQSYSAGVFTILHSEESAVIINLAVDSLTILALTSYGHIIWSVDGGSTWFRNNTNLVSAEIYNGQIYIETKFARCYICVGSTVYYKLISDLGTDGGWYEEAIQDEAYSMLIEDKINVFGSPFQTVLVQEKYS